MDLFVLVARFIDCIYSLSFSLSLSDSLAHCLYIHTYLFALLSRVSRSVAIDKAIVEFFHSIKLFVQAVDSADLF
uniref:Uncharacterized protein n=1 Tax=Trichogramma kaykai TaxID=54128 RepID=A0ABD2W361_9HYME